MILTSPCTALAILESSLIFLTSPAKIPYSHHISGTGTVAVMFVNETPTAPAYDTLVPANRGWSPAVSLRGHFA